MLSEVLLLLGSIGMRHLVADAIELNCGIRKAREDKTPKSPLIAGAWRAQVHGIDLAWRIFCYSCTPPLFSSGSISTWKVTNLNIVTMSYPNLVAYYWKMMIFLIILISF